MIKKSSRVICLGVLCAVLIALNACSEPPSDLSATENAVQILSGIHQNRNYVYYSFFQTNNFRYNTNTSEFSYVCIDPTCDHSKDCPLYDSDIAFVAKDRLYLRGTYYGKGIDSQYYGYYDLTDGTKKILRDCTVEESYGGYPVTDGEYMYYTYKKLRENGDKDNAEDYIPAVCRMNLDGGIEQFLTYMSGENAQLCFAANGRLIFMASNILFSTNPDGSDKKTIYDGEYVIVMDSMHLYGDHIYILAADGSSETRLDGKEVFKRKLLRVNIDTGEYNELLSDHVGAFVMNNEKIYYYPYKLNYLYSPEDLEKQMCEVYTVDYDMWCCELDGSDPQKLFDYENLLISQISCLNGKIYGLFRTFDETTLEKSAPMFMCIDLTDGKTQVIADMSDYFNFVQ